MNKQLVSLRRTVSFALTLLAVTVLCAQTSRYSFAAEPLLEFNNDEQAALYLQLTKDHRCLKCQNQNLADSAAGIAQDLKREIYQRVLQGESGPQISAYLVERYGDFVLYKPPLKASTIALWIGPFLLLIAALWYAVRISKQSLTQTAQTQQTDSKALSKARELLDE